MFPPLRRLADRLAHKRRLRELRRQGIVRLNLGCGNMPRWDYVNVDTASPYADVKLDARALTAFDDNSVSEIATIHMIEHLPRKDVQKALREWYRVLRPGGKLVIRCPNFEIALRAFLEGDASYHEGWGMVFIFGDDKDGMRHTNGFTVASLRQAVERAGFADVRVTATKSFHAPPDFQYYEVADLLCEAVKPPQGERQ